MGDDDFFQVDMHGRLMESYWWRQLIDGWIKLDGQLVEMDDRV